MFERIDPAAGPLSGGLLRGLADAFGYLERKDRWRAGLLLGSSVVNAVLGLVGLASVLPFFQLLVAPDPLAASSVLGRALRTLGVTGELQALVLAGIFVVGLVLAKNAYAVLHGQFVDRFCARIETQLATELLRRIVSAPFNWYLRQNASVLRDVVVSQTIIWARQVIRPTLMLTNNFLILVSSLALLLPLTPSAALLMAAGAVAISAALVGVSRPRLLLTGARKQRSNLLAGIAAGEATSGGRDVRMSRAGTILIGEFERNWSIYSYSDADARKWQSVPRLGIEVVGAAAIVGIALGLAFSGMDRVAIATVLTLYAVIAVRLIPVVGETASGVSTIQMAIPLLDRFCKTLKELPKPEMLVEEQSLFDGWQALSLHRVSFRYDDLAGEALDGIDLTLERGRSYGLVGASGAGKSTLADIISGLLTPTAGEVSVDNRALDGKTRSAWRAQVSYVSQTPLLFDTRLVDNVTLGDHRGDSEQRLKTAIVVAGLEEVVTSLPDGAETHIGDRGVRLSGGQRQRVAIARAVFRGTDLMVLDEATSALDSLTEREVTQAIDALKGRLTLVVIAHRLSTVVRCDEIIVLENGRISARGPHDRLMASDATYRSFVEAQELQVGS